MLRNNSITVAQKRERISKGTYDEDTEKIIIATPCRNYELLWIQTCVRHVGGCLFKDRNSASLGVLDNAISSRVFTVLSVDKLCWRPLLCSDRGMVTPRVWLSRSGGLREMDGDVRVVMLHCVRQCPETENNRYGARKDHVRRADVRDDCVKLRVFGAL